MDWEKVPIEYCDESGYRGKNGEDWDWTLWVIELGILFIVHPVTKGHDRVKVNPELYGQWSAYTQGEIDEDIEDEDQDFDFYETEEEAKKEVEKVVKKMLNVRIKSIAKKLKDANEKLVEIG